MKDFEQFDHLSPDARKVLSYAQEEAKFFGHNYIGTEHLLLGLTRLGEGASATVLKNLGVELNKVRSAVEFIIGHGDRIVLGEIGLTPRAKQIIALAFDEAQQMNQEVVGPEHLLLGLVREGEGIAAGVLQSLGVTLTNVRQEVYRVLGQPLSAEKAKEAPGYQAAKEFIEATRTLRVASRLGGAIMPPLGLLLGLSRRYHPWHIEATQPQRAAVGTGAIPKAIPGAGQHVISGTLLGWAVVNTGGEFMLTLYDGLEAEKPPLAVITNPPTSAFFPFHCFVQQGLTYTLEGTPGSVTIIYDDVEAEQAFP